MVKVKESMHVINTCSYEYTTYDEFYEHCREMNLDGYRNLGYYKKADNIWFATYERKSELNIRGK